MDHSAPSNALQALADFVRQRLAEVWARRDEPEVLPPEAPVARQLAGVVVGAAAPFAPTPHARLRLLRQMHASGLLTQRETEHVATVLGVPR